MRVAFTGSRSWIDVDTITATLEALLDEYGIDNLEICHGQSPGGGADLLVEQIADELYIRQRPFPIDRVLDGNHRGAPLNRNKRMLVEFKPDKLIAFRAAGKSNGTDNTIKNAELLGIPVEKVKEIT